MLHCASVVEHPGVTQNEAFGIIRLQCPFEAEELVANDVATVGAAYSIGEWQLWQALAVVESHDDGLERIFGPLQTQRVDMFKFGFGDGRAGISSLPCLAERVEVWGVERGQQVQSQLLGPGIVRRYDVRVA